MSKLKEYKQAVKNIPETQLTWPLFGSGVEKLGKSGKPVEGEVPVYNSNELLMRIDAVSLCYTDVKEIKQGPNHPRLTGRDLKNDPIIPGHEVCMTVVGVGNDLASQYKNGDRYTLQPDVWVDGKSIPFCFGMDGGYRQYARIGKEILAGDAGNYLIPIPDDMSYAAAAITEPWACVEASYRMEYRDGFKKDGSVLFCGNENSRRGYSLENIWGKKNQPGKITISEIPSDFRSRIDEYCRKNHVDLVESTFINILGSEEKFDDIISLDCPAKAINNLSKKLKKYSFLVINNKERLKEQIEVDLGNLHYDHIVYMGTTSLNIDNAYKTQPIRAHLKPGGNAWFLGAGGPMGRMHVQRAIELHNKPKEIFTTNRGFIRLNALRTSFTNLSLEKQVEFKALSPTEEKNEYERYLKNVLSAGGFNDIVVMVANPEVVENAVPYLSTGGVLNLFAGINRGIKAKIDAWNIFGPKQIRLIGYSGSKLDDQLKVVEKSISGELKPDLSVAAVGGLRQIADGIIAMQKKAYPGKIVIYPHVLDYPLTPLRDFQNKDAEVYAALGEEDTWSSEAEAVFLNKTLN
jgi:threonine dehydrogenase-like Zn-dependent dehydrogenase